jgi:hypothetical protein
MDDIASGAGVDTNLPCHKDVSIYIDKEGQVRCQMPSPTRDRGERTLTRESLDQLLDIIHGETETRQGLLLLSNPPYYL